MPTSFRTSAPPLKNGYHTYLGDSENKMLSGSDAWNFTKGVWEDHVVANQLLSEECLQRFCSCKWQKYVLSKTEVTVIGKLLHVSDLKEKLSSQTSRRVAAPGGPRGKNLRLEHSGSLCSDYVVLTPCFPWREKLIGLGVGTLTPGGWGELTVWLKNPRQSGCTTSTIRQLLSIASCLEENSFL